MAQYRTPGVYIEEAPSVSRVITGIGTTTAAFIGLVQNTVKPKDPITNEDKALPEEAVAVKVNNWGEFKKSFGDIQDGNKILANAVYGFFNNGGTLCFVARVNGINQDTVKKALDAFKAIDEISLVAIPLPLELTSGTPSNGQPMSEDIRKQINDAVLQHCKDMGDRFAILDGVDANSIYGSSETKKYGAVYFPYLDLDGKNNYIPPSGHLAGIYARVDTERGIYKAPANEVILGVQGVQVAIDKIQQGDLNEKNINVIRLFNGNVTVWGARTLNENLEYINVRRTLIFLSESIEIGTQWAVFEPNTPALWQKIVRNVSDFLLVQWRSGALLGNTPQEAFYVKCDAETNPPELRERGQVKAEVGVSIVKPAEFVIFSISQTTLPSR